MMPLAHLGHVLIDAPIFVGPVLVLAGWVWWSGHREKASGEEPSDGESSGASSSDARTRASELVGD
jgi:hypothetical protein